MFFPFWSRCAYFYLQQVGLNGLKTPRLAPVMYHHDVSAMPRLKSFDNMTSLKLGSQFSELKRIEKAIFLQLWHFPSMPTQPLKLGAMRSPQIPQDSDCMDGLNFHGNVVTEFHEL